MTDPTAAPDRLSYGFTIKAMLVPLLTRPLVARCIKYTVYSALVINFGFYIYDDYMAFKAALPEDAPWSEILTQFSTTIDMFAWLGLVFLFELETYALPDEAFDSWIPKALMLLRLVCYTSIGYAAYGYTIETLDYYKVSRLDNISNVCDLADQGVSLQLDVIEYAEITTANCASLSDESVFWQAAGEVSVMDDSLLHHGRFMGKIDISNAVVWLIVAFLIEIEVLIQSADQFSSKALKVVRQAKTCFYLVLITNGAIWFFNDYYLYAWDAFLWIFGFWAIELNLAEWEQDRRQEMSAAGEANTA